MKEVRIRPQISDNDLKTLVNRTLKWFKKQERVKISVSFRGRQHLFMEELGPETIERFLEMLGPHRLVNRAERKGRRYQAVIDP